MSAASTEGTSRAIVAAAFGITLGVLFGPAEHVAGTSITAAALFLLGLGATKNERPFTPILFGLASFLAGLVAANLGLPGPETITETPALVAGEPVWIEGRVAEAPELGLDADALLIDVATTSTRAGAPGAPASGRVRVRIPHAAGRLARAEPCAEAGDRVQLRATLRPLNPPLVPLLRSRRLAVRRGVQLAGDAERAEDCTRIEPATLLGARTTSLRTKLHDVLLPEREGPARDPHAADVRALVAAIATGDRRGMSRDEEQRLVDAGLGHVLVLPGLTLAVLVGLFAAVLERATPQRRWLRVALVLTALASLTIVLGATPSIVRLAIVLAVAAVGTLAVGLDAWSALALGVIASLAASPAGLGDVAFQLPFAAIAATIRTYPALRTSLAKRLGLGAQREESAEPASTAQREGAQREESAEPAPSVRRAWGTRLASSALATGSLGLAVVIGTAPLVARLFERVTLGSLFAGVVAIPLAACVAGPLAIVGGLAGLVLELFAAPFTALASLGGLGLSTLATALAASEPFPLPKPTMAECLLFYGAVMAFAARPRAVVAGRRRLDPRRAGALAVVALVVSMSAGVWLGRPRAGLRVSFLPVSVGRAVAIEGADGEVLASSTAPPSAGLDLGERALANHLHLHRVLRADAILVFGTGAAELASARDLARQLHARAFWIVGAADAGSTIGPELDGLAVHRLVPGAPQRLGTLTVEARVDGGLDVRFGATTVELGPDGHGRADGVVVDGPARAGERAFDTRTEGLVVVEGDGAHLEVHAFKPRSG